MGFARFNAVGFCLTGIRIWQWTSSFFVYASFSLLYAHIRNNRLGENNRTKGVQVLGLVSLVYSTFVLCAVHISKTLGQRSWRVFAVVSVPGDLTIMGICLAKITILSFSGLPADCHGLTRQNYDGNDLVRQPTNGYDTIGFGAWGVQTAGELDELCTFPRTVYGLSVAAIFSYTFSILLSVLYLQGQEPEAVDSEKNIPRPSMTRTRDSVDGVETVIVPNWHAPSSTAAVDLESNMPPSSRPSIATTSNGGSYPPAASIPPPWSHMSIARSASTASTASTASSSYHQSVSIWDFSTLAHSDTETSTSNSESVVSGPSGLPHHPVRERAGHAPRRWSVGTNSSRDANAHVATDEYFHRADPPAYSSRPGSLYQESMKYEAGLPLAGGSRAS